MTLVTRSPILKILIVDDEPFICSTVKQMLKAIGTYDVKDARDGATALNLVERFKPNIVLCDVGMAPMSGLELIKKMRGLADPVLSQTAVIMLTGNGDEGIVVEALKLGIAGYLLKPVSAKDLRGRIEAAIKKGLPGFEAAAASGRAAP